MKNNTIKHPTVEKYIKILTNKGYSIKTIKTYSFYLEQYILHINKNPYKLNKKDLSGYLLSFNYTSRPQQNQIISMKVVFTE